MSQQKQYCYHLTVSSTPNKESVSKSYCGHICGAGGIKATISNLYSERFTRSLGCLRDFLTWLIFILVFYLGSHWSSADKHFTSRCKTWTEKCCLSKLKIVDFCSCFSKGVFFVADIVGFLNCQGTVEMERDSSASYTQAYFPSSKITRITTVSLLP